jgi:zinc protease
MRIVTLLSCVTVLFSARITPAAAQPDITRFVTQTGARVLIRPDNNSDIVAICVFVKAGAADEAGMPGLGSVVARAIFGGNLNQSSEEVNRCIYDVGGSLTITWDLDYTLITCVTTAGQFRDAFYLICNALKFPQFVWEGFLKARAEVAVEAVRESTDPFRVAYSALRARMYQISPYRIPFGGSANSLKRVTLEAVDRFHKRLYTPENTVVSVVGKIRVKDVEEDAENYFVDYKRPTLRGASNAPERPKEEGRVSRPLGTNTTTILAGFPGPGINDPDYPAFVALTALIGGGKSSRLWQTMRERAGVGYVVGAMTPPLALESHLLSFVEFDSARRPPDGNSLDTALVEKLLLETSRSVITAPPTQREVERAKTYAIGTLALAHQRTRDRAFYLGWYELVGPGYAFDTDLPKKIGAVTLEDVTRVAKKYLNSFVVSIVQPNQISAPHPAQ